MSNNFVEINTQYGIVVRKAALSERNISRAELFKCMEEAHPFSQSDTLISFGLHFGKDAANVFMGRLEKAGLKNIDDFFIFEGDFPDWCQFFAKHV